MRGFVLTCSDRPLVVELATESNRELRALKLSRSEKHGAAWKRLSGSEQDPVKKAVAAFQTSDALFADGNVVPLEAFAIAGANLRRPVRAQNEVASPRGQLQRQSNAAISLSVNGDRLISNL